MFLFYITIWGGSYMIYSEVVKKAMQIAASAHQGQTDKGGYPYFFHPIHLAEQMEDEVCTAVALLHDVVEDTSWTFADLQQAGIGEDILAPLKLLTHKQGVAYMDYIAKIKENPVARRVKIADLTHNADLSRLPIITETDKMREKKYHQALSLLLDEKENHK